ncbi:MAG TPA: arginine deiminase family protein [Gemmatimonadaceae bacterium]|nr:arginine deiminase family protein [Gemmatimonadaceae bacterium]
MPRRGASIDPDRKGNEAVERFTAVTREVSPAFERCELTHLARTPLSVDLARAQHREYERCLEQLGGSVVRLEPAPNAPDSVFVEDTAVVFDECAVITRPGAVTRRGEVTAVEELLRRYRPVWRMEAPATLDGGDVLRVGSRVFVGLSSRTNANGVQQLRELLAPHGYRVHGVSVHGCLHLKSAVTALSGHLLLINRSWTSASAFSDLELLDVDASEPFAANALPIGDTILYAAAFPRTRERIEARGFQMRAVELSELAKAEGAVTCCSLILR